MLNKIDFLIFGKLINWLYKEYYRPRFGYQRYYILFFHYWIPQRIFRLNPKVPWPVHYTSKVVAPHKIIKGILCDPGDNINNYIQANNGIEFGSNIELGPGVSIISSNHDANDLSKHSKGKKIIIGNHVWIGANATVLPEVNIGDNVIIGANSVVTKDIPSNSVAAGNPCKVLKSKEPYTQDLKNVVFNKTIPTEYLDFINS